MGNVSNLQSGQSFKVIQKIENAPGKGAGDLKITDTNNYINSNAAEKQKAAVRNNFAERYGENGKVELRIEDSTGMAVIQGSKIDLDEMLEQGGTLARFAAELKKFDENGDHKIEEDELYTSWGEQLGGSATTIGVATASTAGTGATFGAMGGTVVVPGIGTVVGAGGLGLVGGALGFLGSTAWEGVRAVGYAMGDKYNSPSWAR